MKKIKITENQAKKLGLLNEAEDSGLKSSGNAMGDLIVRIVISGPELSRFKDRALALVLRQDPTADVQYYEQTGKIVGNIKDIKRQSIERDIKALDPTITVEKKVATPPKIKEGVKNVIKLTKEQYNRIFASGLINESDGIKGGEARVDLMAKKQFAGSGVKNLKPVSVSEEDGITADSGSSFDIKKPNTQIPSSAQGKFGKPVMENESVEDKVKKETIELIRYLYRKSEDLSPFWEENGLSYDDICTALLDKKLIVKKGGKHELSKALGNPKAAIQALETELRGLIGDKPKNEIQDAPMTDAPMTDAPIDEYDNYNYPAGADADPNAPWHRDDPEEPSKMAKNPQLTPIVNNSEITILKDPKGQMYAIYHDAIDREEFYPYASVERKYAGKDEDGDPQYDYDFENVEIDGDVVSNYVNDNLASLSKGEGVEDWESGVNLVKLDDGLKQELLSLYDKDKNVVKLLGSVDESESEGDRMTRLKAAIEKKRAESKQWEDEFFRKRDAQNAIASANAEEKMKIQNKPISTPEPKKPTGQYDIFGDVEETTGAASSGAFAGSMSDVPVIKREMPDVPVVGEESMAKPDGLEMKSNNNDNASEVKNAYHNTPVQKSKASGYKTLYVPRKIYDLAFANDSDNNGPYGQGLISIISRGGYAVEELNNHLPNWRTMNLDSVNEMTAGSGSVGAYDANALPGIGRNGEFKGNKKTKAETTPQYAGGSFVKQPACSKLDNNKTAQNGGCNQGAGSVKTIKAKGSINAPSLGENEIFEAIAKKTGKTIEEVRQIINTKKSKA